MSKKDRPPCVVNLQPSEIKAGDTGYARTTGFMGFLIRVGEKLKWRNGKYNHAFTVIEAGDTYDDIKVVQATLRGVIVSSFADVMVGAYLIDVLPAHESWRREDIVRFALEQVGDPYGILSILCIAIDILSPDWFIEFRRNLTWVCSAVSGEALRFGGMLKSWGSIYDVTPTNLFLEHSKQLGLAV